MRSRPSKNAAPPASSPDSASAASSASGSPTFAAAASSSGISACPGRAAVVASGREEDRGCGFFFWQQQREQRVPYGRVLQSILSHAENRHVLRQFLFFALLLAAVPISALLMLPQVLQYLWEDPAEATAAENADLQLRAAAAAAARNWAAIAAVISVNLIALSYAYSAYREEVSDWRLLSQQQQQRHGATATAEVITAEALTTEVLAAEAPAGAVEAAAAGAAPAKGKRGKGDARREKKQKGS